MRTSTKALPITGNWVVYDCKAIGQFQCSERLVGVYSTYSKANAKAEKLNQAYGAARYGVMLGGK